MCPKLHLVLDGTLRTSVLEIQLLEAFVDSFLIMIILQLIALIMIYLRDNPTHFNVGGAKVVWFLGTLF